MTNQSEVDRVLNPKAERCAHCGEVAAGHAFIGDARYCHGDDARPSCYELASRLMTARLHGNPAYLAALAEADEAAPWPPDEENARLLAEWLAGPGRRPTDEDRERWASRLLEHFGPPGNRR